MLCREAEASKASPGCGRILKHDPPSVPACSPAVTMSSLSCCLSHSTILCCLNQFWPQGSIYMRLTHPNIQTQAHACVFSDAHTHTHTRLVCAKMHLHSPRTSLASAFYANQTKVGSSAISVESCCHFSASLLPLLSSSQSFLKVHICLWFLNQPAKFTTLRSTVFYSWLCCM